MRYIMRQKLFSWGDDFTIKTEDGRDAFFVDGKAFSLGNQLSFQDMNGNELAFIRQRLLAWGPTYEIYRGGEVQASSRSHCSRSCDAPSRSMCRAPTTWRPPGV
jgi:uncharacterized protein YxjI